MLLWKNPHPDREIAALEVKGCNAGIPESLGLSIGAAQRSRRANTFLRENMVTVLVSGKVSDGNLTWIAAME